MTLEPTVSACGGEFGRSYAPPLDSIANRVSIAFPFRFGPERGEIYRDDPAVVLDHSCPIPAAM